MQIKYGALLLAAMLGFSSQTLAEVGSNENLRIFLKDCGMGVLIGAAVGVVAMSMRDQPNEHGQDIAKGASLGLYGGIIYSYYDLTYVPKNRLGIEVGSTQRLLPILAVSREQVHFAVVSDF